MPRFLEARWIDLVMLNYAIDPAIVAGRVPAGTELDTWRGQTFVSMVGFQFRDTRVRGFAIPFHRHFDEVNLRFYVRRHAPEGTRRGVVFIKEIVPRRAIAWLARWRYNENYVRLRMRHEDEVVAATRRAVAYEWRTRGGWNRLGVQVSGASRIPDPASEESFITEHYWGYVGQRDGSTLEYQVEHPRWRVWRAVDAGLDCEVERLYGPAFADACTGAPSSAFLAEGSEVTVRRGRALA